MTDINSIIINNGFFSNSFNIERGVRQGCPLSSSLFIICIEYLSHHIQSNKHIKDISLEPDEEIKQSLFSDDATYFLNDNYDSFHNLIESLTLYGLTSGLKQNKSKCTVLRVGKLKQSNVQYKKEMKFNWTSDEATTLGITFTNNEKDTVLKNILPKLQNFKNCLKSWHHQNGGIQLTNIDSFLNAIKCSWVKRCLDNTNTSKWKLFYQKILKKYGDSLIFECNISNTILHEIANENIFLSDVLSAWSDVTHNLETQTSSKTILWNNKDITSNNKTFFYKDWFERSIKYVDQLYDYRIKDFYSFDNICYIYGTSSNLFLKYYTLIKSIPIHIKSEINTNNTPCTQTTFVENILGRKKTTNKIFYTLQIKNPTENSKLQNKWQVHFGENELNWKHIFTMPYKATIEYINTSIEL
ncbi:hypothetical protein DPMN_088505 [Dreissena polymorpha]|uniref:Reverse transcriptase domain-containing protein n=1 Tax=Dreissena polymorpha TaxID=45954 RepID=A0A9D4KWB0_DREPO|nr:hypothetical protein DPMN_088505 [Dreissena polymorpha]